MVNISVCACMKNLLQTDYVVMGGQPSTNAQLEMIALPIDIRHSEQEAQLPQRNSASAAHVYLGWQTDRANHWTIRVHRMYTVFQKNCANLYFAPIVCQI